jgi:outer membrane lipoprotein-sorting protein
MKMVLNTISLRFSFVFFISICSISLAQYDAKAEAILEKLSKKYELIKAYKAEFICELENPQAKVKDKFSGEINVKGAKFTITSGNQHIINNGTTVWTYLKEENEVNISDYTPDEDEITPTKIYSIYKSGFKYLLNEEEKIKNVVFDVIELVPENKNKPYFKIKIWVNRKEQTIARWRIFEKNGNRFLYTVQNFQANAKLEDEIFTFDKAKYKGVEVVDLR